MGVTLDIRNESARKRLYRRAALCGLAESIFDGEGIEGDTEISLLLCDDDFMRALNKDYRNSNRPTDVLSFEQAGHNGRHHRPGPKVLGDIVISLETAESNCQGDRSLMREEVFLLFCHGLLHLLGYDHATRQERTIMTGKQAQYLGISKDAAWRFGPKQSIASGSRNTRGGGSNSLGR